MNRNSASLAYFSELALVAGALAVLVKLSSGLSASRH